MIVSTGLTKAFPTKNGFRRKVVNNLSFEVEGGEIFTLLGPNGAGKTTTMRMLAGILPPTEGTAEVGGNDVVLRPEKVRQDVGVLSEHPGLYERMSVGKNLEIFGRFYGLGRQPALARAKELLEIFGLAHKLQNTCGTLSKGEKQMVAIAKALVHNPAWVFLDEPTSALDPTASAKVRQLIMELSQSYARGFFVNTHNLAEAEMLATKIGILKEGKLVTIATPSELRSQGASQYQIRFSPPYPELSNLTPIVDESLETKILNYQSNILSLSIEGRSAGDVMPRFLKALIEAGWLVCEAREMQDSLEEIYLREINQRSPQEESL